ncbi:putative bifunctional diguanylate cyclase/phosphodiesterase [Spiribacter halobius]|uniref:putative bifunctional diguanylate cyclase/phosphodiesterase n=1 Tax=Sediminicurvatus halobius TaxID=2182432 RepID=UPI001304CCAD|nr:EAL domain-containing protein [Spiribacter halobius]UEX79678.1 EAL domain-containing protein [Spiribacter halobius]
MLAVCGLYALAGLTAIPLIELIVIQIFGDVRPLSLAAGPGLLFVSVSAPVLALGAWRLHREHLAVRRRYEALVQHSLDGLLLTAPDGRILTANPAACQALRYTERELQGAGRASVLDESDLAVQAFLAEREAKGQARGEFWARRKDGRRIRVEVGSALFQAAGDTFTSMSFRDITDRVVETYRAQLADVAFDKTSECIGVLDSKLRIIWANPAFERVTGWRLTEIIGQVAPFYRLLEAEPESLRAFEHAMESQGYWTGELTSRRANGELYPLAGAVTRVINDVTGEVQYVATFTDTSLLEEYEAQLSRAGRHDEATGLATRWAFEESCETALAKADPQHESVGLYLLNLDHFGHVNQSLGHAAGDRCLREVANRLVEADIPASVVARHGGDSFLIMVPSLRSQEDTGLIARQLKAVFEQPVEIDGSSIALTASIGISVFPTDGMTVDAMLRAAESALDSAKADGGDDFRYYREGAEERAREFVSKTSEIRAGIRRREFAPYFQPIVDAVTGSVEKFEVLARWKHPTRGVLGPAEFIGVAERSGLIGDLSHILLEEAAREMSGLCDRVQRRLVITFNLSARQLRQEMIANHLLQVVIDNGLAANQVVFEITESTIMDDPPTTRRILEELRGYGFRILLDDFGTGYSSLNYLRRLPVDGLKIDRSFVARVADDVTDAAIVKAILAVARELRLRVVAEGIEEEQQAECLRRYGCDQLQGFLFAKPMPGEELEHYLTETAER